MRALDLKVGSRWSEKENDRIAKRLVPKVCRWMGQSVWEKVQRIENDGGKEENYEKVDGEEKGSKIQSQIKGKEEVRFGTQGFSER